MTQFTFTQVEQLWTGAGGSVVFAPLMAAVAEVESSLNSAAYNASGASGLWQIEVPLHDDIIPGGAANVFDPQANAKAAVTLSGNNFTGIWDNWLRWEPAGKALGIAKQNGYTGPTAGVIASVPGISSGDPSAVKTSSTDPLSGVSATITTMGTLLGDSAKALDWFFHFFKPGQGWRILFGVGAGASAYGGIRSWQSAAGSDDTTSALPLAVLLFGVAFLCAFMTLRQWPTGSTGAPIKPAAYATDIIQGHAPQAGAPPSSDADAIEAGLGALLALWGASKVASGLSGLGNLLGGLGNLLGSAGGEAAEAGVGE
jgi:hypothetical protein